jgi:hydrogenase maturation protease
MGNLDTVVVPGVMRSLVKMNLVRDVSIADGKVDVSLASAALAEGSQEWLKDRIKDTTSKLAGVKEVNVSFVDDKPKDLNRIGNVIAIMSGKGGVGKSLVAGLTAIALRRRGYEVGILDADITGPSIPKMFGITARPAGSDSGMLPVSSKSGIEVMSINLFLPSEDDAVIWRGPLIGRAITQFWEEVLWGKLDYLIVDLPPGTADAPLTVLQTLPISGIIIVFTPQNLTAMVVRKAVNMAKQMGKPILGVIENMSYLYVPEIGKKIELFGKSHGEEMAHTAGAPLLGQLPIDPQLAQFCDEGDIERYDAEIVTRLGESLSQLTSATVSSEKK